MRRLVLGLLVGVYALAQAGVASAHEEINPSTFPTGKAVFFALSAADETTADLVKVTLTAPQGTPFGATTKEPTGWTVNRTDQVITWTGGGVKPNRFDQWGFEIEGADQPGTLSYKVTLGFADGKTDDVTVDVDAVVASSAASANGGGSTSRANAALGVGLIALVLAAAGLAMGLRRRPTAPSPAGPGASKPGPEASKTPDW